MRDVKTSAGQQPMSWKPVRLATAVGVTIGLSILGDSLLYNILPLQAAALGISLPLVGILLSANRLIRLVSNTWISVIFDTWGPRSPFIAVTVLAFLTTALYGIGWGFITFLFARLGWGIAWSGLRQGGYQAIWAGEETARGKLTGLLWGLVRLGSALSVTAGGYLWDRFGYQISVGIIAGFSALALPMALSIRWPPNTHHTTTTLQRPLYAWRQVLSHSPSRRLVLVGFLNSVFEGMLVSTASLFLVGRLGADRSLTLLGIGVGTITGTLLAVRWVSGLVFGPAVGVLSDRYGQPPTATVFSGISFVGITGAVGFTGLIPAFCLALVFIANSSLNITLIAAASHMARRSERPHLFVGVYTTGTDAGSALGPLVAYSLGNAIDLPTLYLVVGSILTLSVLRYWQSA